MGKSWWERFTEEWKKEKGDGKKTRTFHWLLLFACVGAAMMLISSFVNVKREAFPPQEALPEAKETATSLNEGEGLTIQAYEEKIAQDLSDLLEKVVGLEQVSVNVNLTSTEIVVLEKNVVKKEQVTEEQDQRGGTRKITDSSEERQVVTVQGKQGEEPIVVQRLKPSVNGIMIVAKGVENLETKAAVLKAVRAYLDVPPHKIAILPKG